MVCAAQGKPILLVQRQDPLWKWSLRRVWAEDITPITLDLLERARGAVVLWRTNVHACTGIKQVEALSALGVVGHISRTRMMINTTHSTSKDRKRCRAEREGCSPLGIFEIRTDDFDHICGLCQTNPTPHITMISDGLVGQVFIEPQDV